VFALLIFAFFAANILKALLFFIVFLTSASNMQTSMIEKISRAPILFFDSNPVGRIMTRLSKDRAILDTQIPTYSLFTLTGIWRTISVFIAVMVFQPWLVLVILFFSSFMFMFFMYAASSII
jgi:ABC-type multidrug transport system fused ATPase/permease subunit